MMKFRNFYLLALVLVCFTSTLQAQTAKLEKAKRLMKELNYQAAIELLTQVTSKNDNAEAKINLAECYRKVSDSGNAEFLYGQVVRLPEAQPIHYLYYGEMLQRNGKCDLAKEWYQKFNEAVPEDIRGQYMSKACDYEQELKTKGEGIYEVKRATFNSQFDDFGSHFYKDGIIFASERDRGIAIKRDHSWTGQPFLDLYFIPIKNCGTDVTYGRPEPFSKDLNTKYHDAVVTFNKEQSQMYFTRNNYINGKVGTDDEGIMKLQIYTAKKAGNSWSKEEGLPFNSNEYSCAHPSLTEDGNKLYFASDMPGGFGGMDLYVSELENGKWGPPMNLGQGINTEGHELFPFIHPSGRLYFASDGHMGLGGMDILFIDDKGNGQWGAPENVGAPINSKDDDFSISLNADGTCGFFSSDREGGSGRDDIYSFTKKAAPVKVYVYDAVTLAAIEGATVVADSLNKTMKTGKDGKAMVEMRFNTCSNFAATMEGYEPMTKQGCVKDAASVESSVVEIPLQKVFKHTVEGVVFDLASGLPLSEATVQLIGGSDSIKSVVTDASGRFSFSLEKEFCYRLRGEKDKYFAETTPDTICTKDLKESKNYLVNLNLQQSNAQPKPNDVVDAGKKDEKGGDVPPAMPTDKKKIDPKQVYFDEKQGVYVQNNKPFTGKKNGITYKDGKPEGKFIPSERAYPDGDGVAYLLHIYYDFDQAFIRKESKSELEKLQKLMKDNPNFIIEIASHTDTRGSNSYNQRLSQRRAESVVKWLIEHGIERDRLVPRGYGESLTTNECKDLVKCDEKDHQMNRRTEFRVLGCKDCVDKDKEILSRPNPKAKVDKCHGCPF